MIPQLYDLPHDASPGCMQPASSCRHGCTTPSFERANLRIRFAAVLPMAIPAGTTLAGNSAPAVRGRGTKTGGRRSLSATGGTAAGSVLRRGVSVPCVQYAGIPLRISGKSSAICCRGLQRFAVVRLERLGRLFSRSNPLRNWRPAPVSACERPPTNSLASTSLPADQSRR